MKREARHEMSALRRDDHSLSYDGQREAQEGAGTGHSDTPGLAANGS